MPRKACLQLAQSASTAQLLLREDSHERLNSLRITSSVFLQRRSSSCPDDRDLGILPELRLRLYLFLSCLLFPYPLDSCLGIREWLALDPKGSFAMHSMS